MFFEVLLNILPSDISNHKLLRWSLKLDEPIEDPSPTDRSGQRNEAKMGKLQDLLKYMLKNVASDEKGNSKCGCYRCIVCGE